MHFCSPAITEFNNVYQLGKSIISAAHHLKHPHERKALQNRLTAKGHLSREPGGRTKKHMWDCIRCVCGMWRMTYNVKEGQREIATHRLVFKDGKWSSERKQLLV